jgi:hypothetical protein
MVPLNRPKRRSTQAELPSNKASPTSGFAAHAHGSGAGPALMISKMAVGGLAGGLALSFISNMWGCKISSALGSGIGASIVGSVLGIQANSCNGGIDPATQEALDSLKGQIKDANANTANASTQLWNRVSELNNAQLQFMNTTQQQWSVQAAFDNSTLRGLQNLNNQTGFMMSALNTATATTAALTTQLAGLTNTVNTNVGTLNRAVANLSLSTEQSVRALASAMANLSSSSAAADAEIVTRLTNLQTSVEQGQFTSNTLIEQLVGNIMRQITRAQERRVHTKRFRANLVSISNASCLNSPGVPSCVYRPHLRETGVAPLIDSGDSFYQEAEAVFIRYIRALGGGTNIATQELYQFRCSANTMVDGLAVWQNPNDVLHGIGPTGCDPFAPDAGYCNCYVSHVTQSCVVDSRITNGADRARWYKNTTSPWNTLANFNASIATGGTFCAGGSPTSVVETITSATQLASAMQTLLQTTLFSDSGYVATTRQSKLIALLDPIPSLTTWTPISFVSGGFQTSVPKAIMTFVTSTQSAFSAVSGQIGSVIDGTLSADLSFYDYPMTVSPGGSTAQCSQSAFVAYSTYMLPIQRGLLTGILRTGTVVTSQRCVASVCEAAVNVNIADLQFNNDLQSQIPGEFLTVGSVFGDANGQIYDIEQRSISISPDATARKGTTTYHTCPTNELCSAAYFFENSQGIPFDAFSGVNSPSLYARGVYRDSTTHAFRCSGNGTAVAPSSTCDLREEFDMLIGAPDNMTMWLRARASGQVRVTIPVVMGSITQLIVASCPQPTIVGSSSSGVTVSFANPNTYDTILSLSITNGICTPILPEITVVAGGAFTVFVPACTQDPYATFKLSALDVNGNVCPGINDFDITIPPRSQSVYTVGVPDRTYVHSTSVYATDNVAKGLFDVVGRALLATEMNTLLILKAWRFAGIVDPTTNLSLPFANFQEVFNLTQAIGASVEGVRTNINATNWNKAEEDLQTSQAEFERIRAEFDRQRLEQQSQLDNLMNLSTLQAVNIQNFARSVEAVDNASSIFNAAFNRSMVLQEQLNDQLIVALAQLNSAPHDSCAPLCGLGSWLAGAINEVPELANKIGDIAEKAIDKAQNGLFGGLGSGIAGAVATVFSLLAMAVAGCIVIGLLYVVVKKWLSARTGRSSKPSYAPVLELPGMNK